MSGAIKDINHLLHDLRSAHLRRMPKAHVMLSAGCAGTWYFDWIANQTKHTGRHIGIEAYSPKPSDLPSNVEWIANTVGKMDAIENGACDLVFSGENIEHLWPEEVIGFFLESNRVLAPSGWLIVDSPNRLMTSMLGWSHPEHTVELTPTEAANLASLSGFEVVKTVGIWLCQDPDTGRQLNFDPLSPDSQWSLPERVLAAEHHPDQSFIWWMEARKIGEPQPDGLKKLMSQIFDEAWPERSRRFVSAVGTKSEVNGNKIVRCVPSESGPMVYGPYMPLKKGKHRAEFHVVAEGPNRHSAPVVRCDVVGAGGREIVVQLPTINDLKQRDGLVGLDFALPDLEFGIQARCFALGGAAVEILIPPLLV